MHATTKKARVLLVDDHPAVRQAIREIIDHSEDLMVCGEAAGCAEGVDAIATLVPDALVLDVSLPDGNGIDLARDLRSAYPCLPIVMASLCRKETHEARALQAGADAYLDKSMDCARLVPTLRQLLKTRPSRGHGDQNRHGQKIAAHRP